MLRRVTIRGFRSIHEIDAMELGSVNVFVGANGSGKSSILEAVGVLGAAAEGRVDDTRLLSRGVRPGVARLFKTALRNVDRRNAIALAGDWEAGGHCASYLVRIDKDLKSSERAWAYRHELLTSETRSIVGRSPRSETPRDNHVGVAAGYRDRPEAAGAAKALLEALVAYGIYTPTTAVLRGLEADSTQREPIGLKGGGLALALRQLIPRINRDEDLKTDLFSLLDWVDSFGLSRRVDDILSPEVPAVRDMLVLSDRRMKRGSSEVTAYDASEGVLYVLSLVVLALHKEAPAILAVDNYDNGMHPRLCRAATRFLTEQLLRAEPARQVLLTTHNPLALDGLDLRDDRQRLFSVDRGPDGGTVCQRVVLDERLLARMDQNPDLALSQLWVMGLLGGVPDV